MASCMCCAPDARGVCLHTISHPGRQCTNTSADGCWMEFGTESSEALRTNVRQSEGISPTLTAAIIDSQSVKTTEIGGLVAMMLVRR